MDTNPGGALTSLHGALAQQVRRAVKTRKLHHARRLMRACSCAVVPRVLALASVVLVLRAARRRAVDEQR